jgi:hypothetical protein
MTVTWAQWILGAFGAYFAAGVLFAVAFVATGLPRVDAGARGMPWSARLLILPGVTMLWPLMLMKWLTRAGPPVS